MSEDLSSSRPSGFDLPGFCGPFCDQSPDAILAVEGPNLVVRYVNPAFLRLSGKREHELLGRPFAEAVPEGSENKGIDLLKSVYRSGKPQVLLEQRHLRNGPEYWSYSAWPIRVVGERSPGTILRISDTTEDAIFRRRATAMNESLLVSSTRQHELMQESERLGDALRISIANEKYFMSVISHELRTPLTPVLAAVSRLQQDERLDGGTREALAMIERNVTLESRLIDDLLDITRIERGKVSLRREPVDLRPLLDRVAEICAADIEAADLAFEIVWLGGPYIVNADADRLEQVFWTLLKNAIKFTPAGGSVRMEVRPDHDQTIVISLSDTGVGISHEQIPLLFEAFQQGERVQARRRGGLGLGLAISRSMIELHDGQIWAESAGRGRGSTFSVRLPTLPLDTCVRTIPEATVDLTASARALRPLRILLVEDHPDTAEALRLLLTADGHSVETASGVAAGLNRAAEESFDLLISDLGLPDGTGLDLMRELRRKDPTLPGIALSGYGQEDDVHQSRMAGFALHVMKPVNGRRLHDAIAAAVASP